MFDRVRVYSNGVAEVLAAVGVADVVRSAVRPATITNLAAPTAPERGRLRLRLPRYFAAAIRLSRRLTRDGHSTPAWRKHVLGVAAVLWALAAIVEFWVGDPRRGTGWALFTVLYTAITVKDRYMARRLRTRLDMLQALSESCPEALRVLTESAVPEAISVHSRALIVAAVVTAVAAGGAATGYAQHLET